MGRAELGVVGFLAPTVLVLEAVVDQQEQAGGGQPFTRPSRNTWVSASIQCRFSKTTRLHLPLPAGAGV